MTELYTFTVRDGDKLTKAILQKPGMQATRKMTTVYSAAFSKALKMGIMSEIDIRAHVRDDKSKRRYLERQWNELENKRQLLLTQGKSSSKVDEKLAALGKEVDGLNDTMNKTIVDHSAEAFAWQRVIDWLVTNLVLWDDSKLPVFPAEEDEDKMKQYFDALDEAGVQAEVIKRAILIFQAYFIHGVKDTAVFDKVIEEFESTE